MKFNINSNDIHEILKLSKADELSFTGDGNMTYMVAYESDSQIVRKIYDGGTGQVSINKNALKLIAKDTVAEITEDIIITNKRKIKYAKNNIIHEPIKVENYLTTLHSEELNHLLSGYYAMAKDMTRPILNGVCIDKSNFIAIDGYRMTIRKGNFKSEEQIVMDYNLVNILRRIKSNVDKVKIYYNDKYVKFDFEDLIIIGNRIEGNYIQYDSIIPQDYNTSVEIESKPILNILKDYKKNKFKLVKLNFQNDKLVISANNEFASVDEELHIKLQGKPLTIAFNINYLIDALKNYEFATLELTKNISPMVIKAENKLDLVLPVRIKD